MVLFCNLVCVYAHEICDDKFGGCKKSFSWLEQKVTMLTTPARGHGMTPRPCKISRHHSVF